MKPIVFVPEPISASGMSLLLDECQCLAPWSDNELERCACRPDEMLAAADAVIVRLFSVREAEFEAAPRLKVVAKHGVGLDSIDVAAATRRRIPVVFTPAANANAVAEHTLALMLALARQVHPAAATVASGRFHDRTMLEGVELAGKTLGIIGYGRIGRRVAAMARGFDMRVRAFDPVLPADSADALAEIETSLETLLEHADFLTLHVPLTAETRHLIDARRLGMMKPSCRVVNSSRGGIVDESALAEALSGGRLAGAALDVFEQEPLPADHCLLRTPNLLLTPHIASSTRESLDRMARDAAQGVLDVLRGRRPAHLANPEALL